jgi:hypothetical protein
MKNLELNICTREIRVQGFNFQKGFIALLDNNGNALAASSGWVLEQGNLAPLLFVYRPTGDGSWAGEWEGEETFPVEKAIMAIKAYNRHRKRKNRKKRTN